MSRAQDHHHPGGLGFQAVANGVADCRRPFNALPTKSQRDQRRMERSPRSSGRLRQLRSLMGSEARLSSTNVTRTHLRFEAFSSGVVRSSAPGLEPVTAHRVRRAPRREAAVPVRGPQVAGEAGQVASTDVLTDRRLLARPDPPARHSGSPPQHLRIASGCLGQPRRTRGHPWSPCGPGPLTDGL
jgi:hypothetical protein